MTTSAHINFESLGTFTSDPLAGVTWQDTAIAVPDPDDEMIVVRAGSQYTYPFETDRLRRVERVTPGESGTLGGIALHQLGEELLTSAARIGMTAGGNLAVGGDPALADGIVQLWHLVPDDIGLANLQQTLTARLLPVPTEETRGYVVKQDEDAETYELVEDDGGGGSGSDGSAYATVAEYSKVLTDRPELTRSDASVELIGYELDAAAAIIDQWCRRSFRMGTADDARTTVYFAADAHRDIDLQMNPMEALLLPIDDSVSVSEVKMNGHVLASEKWRAEPSVDTTTWTLDQLRLLDNEDYWHGRIEVTRVPGWAAVPPAIKLCNIELAARRRLETPTAFGDSLNAQEVVSGDTRALLFKYLGMYRRELVA